MVTLVYYSPIPQIVMASLPGMILLILYLKIRPHHRLVLNFGNTFIELGFFVIHMMFLVLAIDDNSAFMGEGNRELVGWAIIGLCSLIFIIEAAILIKEYISTMTGYVKHIKAYILTHCMGVKKEKKY